MEREEFVTGYCRSLDRSRMVAAVLEDGALTEVDCAYGRCPHEPNCQIAQKLQELTHPTTPRRPERSEGSPGRIVES